MMIEGTSILFFSLLPIVAFLYAAVGHGGASGYLALMSLFSIAPQTMKPTALLLNLFVAGISFYYFYKEGFFNKKLFLSFAIASIPLAYLGGRIEANPYWYKIILGLILIFAILKMLNIFNAPLKQIRTVKIWQGLLVGAVIGFFSGLIGIGGGIILSPVILLFAWGNVKEAAAVSALFIWVNSAAGLAGQFSNHISLNSQSILMVVLALVGGLLGSYLGSKKMSNNGVRLLLVLVLSAASIKLIFVP